jgi:hypothetical protein
VPKQFRLPDDGMATPGEHDLAYRAFVQGDEGALALWRETYGTALEEQARAAAQAAMMQRAKAHQAELVATNRRGWRRQMIWSICAILVFMALFLPYLSHKDYGTWNPAEAISRQLSGEPRGDWKKDQGQAPQSERRDSTGAKGDDPWTADQQTYAAQIAKAHDVTLVTTTVGQLADGEAGWTTSWQIAVDAKDPGMGRISPTLEISREMFGTVHHLVEKHGNTLMVTFFLNDCVSDDGPEIGEPKPDQTSSVIVKTEPSELCPFR